MRSIRIQSQLFKGTRPMVINTGVDQWVIEQIGQFLKFLPENINYNLSLNSEGKIIDLHYIDVNYRDQNYPWLLTASIIEGKIQNFKIVEEDLREAGFALELLLNNLETNIENHLAKTNTEDVSVDIK